MSQMNSGQARVINPILSDHARGYKQQQLVARALFPLAPVPAYGGQVIEFTKEAFRLYNTRRSPGAATKRIDLGYAGKPYAIVPSALEAKVPRELMKDASQVPGINLASRAVSTVMRVLTLEHEYSSAVIARNAANYPASNKTTLVGTAKWTNAAGNPTNDIETAKEAIRGQIGVYPNVALLSATSFKACKTNPQILDRLKYTSATSVTEDMLATLWGLDKVVVGKAVVATGQNDTFGDVWGNDTVLAYVSEGSDPGVDANAEEPSYGYTYVIEGMPAVEEPYWDANAKSWIYGVSFDNAPQMSGQTAGYLIVDSGAP